MSKTHDEPIINLFKTKRNISLLELFKDYLDVDYISKHFDCWKGNCFWGLENIIDEGKCNWQNGCEEFGGWFSADILAWLIIYHGKYKEVKDDSI